MIRSLLAKTAREQRSFFRVSRMTLESTLGSGDTFYFVAAQGELAFAMILHRGYAFHQIRKNMCFSHRVLRTPCARFPAWRKRGGYAVSDRYSSVRGENP